MAPDRGSHLVEDLAAPSSQLAPAAPATRLPLPRARSVSHLRTQSTSSLPKSTLPGLSRKPSIPLRSGAGTLAPPARPQPQPTAGQPRPAPQLKARALPVRPALHGVKSSLALGPKKTVPSAIASSTLPTTGTDIIKQHAPSATTAWKPSSPGLFTSRSTSSSSNPVKGLGAYNHPPMDRQIRRVVSRGFVMDAPSPTKSHTPSPTKKSHQAIDATPLRPRRPIKAISETPLMPRLANGMGDIDTLPLIADASFSFDDTSERGKKGDEETEELRAALKASEAALSRIKLERDEARAAEEGVKEALKEKQWEAVRRAIQDELERSKEYRSALAAFKAIIIAMQAKTEGAKPAA